MNWLDLFDDQAQGEQARFCAEVREDKHSPCEDDATVVAPYIGRCPDESDHEKGSPLDFGSRAQDNVMFDLAMKLGW